MEFGPKITAFLAAIRVQPNITHASAAAKVGPRSHYEWLKKSANYRKAYAEAYAAGIDAVADIAVKRASMGWEEPIVYQGTFSYPDKWDEENHCFVPDTSQPPLTVRKIDNRLLEFVLSRRHPDYREKVDVQATVTDKRWAGTMEDLLALYDKALQAEAPTRPRKKRK